MEASIVEKDPPWLVGNHKKINISKVEETIIILTKLLDGQQIFRYLIV